MAKIKHLITSLLIAINATLVASHLGGSAHAHRRAHQHHLRDTATPIIQVVPGPTIVVYEFQGHAVQVKEVCEGIKNGTFEWNAGHNDAPNCAPYGFTLPGAVATPAPIPHSMAVSSVVSTLTPISQPSSVSSADDDDDSDQTQGNVKIAGLSAMELKIARNPHVNKEFPDGQIPCSQFPSAYGAIPLDWVGLNGWSGIQYTSMNENAVTHIDTAIKGNDCKTSSGGAVAYCSYACPPGYQKSQWPSTQGDAKMAVSVGGLKCGTDNKLYLTNPGLSKNLCIPGTGQVSVKNKLSQKTSICRTDYPENMVVPLVVQSGQDSPLTCPNSATYYKHLGSPTTAQYYVNMKGVTVNNACQWDTDGSHEGNWAPTVFGLGMDQNGKTWLSIQSTIQNSPSNYEDLDFTVELQGDFGGAKCFYKNGHYCSTGDPGSADLSKCQTTQNAAVPGCTVQLMSGNATYVLS